MAENRRMTAAELADELMSSEHADVVRESRLVGDLPSASQRHPPQRQTHLHWVL